MKESLLVTFMFHKLGKERFPGDIYSLNVDWFRAFIERVGDYTNEVISLEQLNSISPEKNRKLVALTFDDGYETDYTNALPLLEKFNIVATFFIVPMWIGNTGYLNWSQVRKLSERGMSIGSHGLTHQWLPELSDEELKYELNKSKQKIEEKIGRPVKVLSLPGGYLSPRVLTEAFEAGYSLICTSQYGIDKLPVKKRILKRNSIDLRSSWPMIEKLLIGRVPLKLLISNWKLNILSRIVGPSSYEKLSASLRKNEL